MTNYNLSVFENTFQTIGKINTLFEELEFIKNGKYKTDIIKCRKSLIIEENKDNDKNKIAESKNVLKPLSDIATLDTLVTVVSRI